MYGVVNVSCSGHCGVGLFLVGERIVTQVGSVPRALAQMETPLLSWLWCVGRPADQRYARGQGRTRRLLLSKAKNFIPLSISSSDSLYPLTRIDSVTFSCNGE